MIRREDVQDKVMKFIEQEFPEIITEVKEGYVAEEFGDLLYAMLVGEFQEEEG